VVVGKRRYVTGEDNTTNSIVSASSRDFTGHEFLEELRLVHMGGRIYDPVVARFLSPDPFVQDPFNLQNLNRYTYVLNILGFLGEVQFLGKAVLHGTAQGALSEARGGEFGPAFLAASFAHVAGSALGRVDAFKGDGFDRVVGRTMAAAAVGGTASVIGGGKFQNGAATAAFVHLFNDEAPKALAGMRRFRTEGQLQAALAAAGENAFVTGTRPLAGVAAYRNRFLELFNSEPVHEHLFYLGSDGSVQNTGYMGPDGLGRDPGFPENIRMYLFDKIQKSAQPLESIVSQAASGRFQPGNYNLLGWGGENCQTFCQFVREQAR
jgi:RHS repeat-associated protein